MQSHGQPAWSALPEHNAIKWTGKGSGLYGDFKDNGRM